MTITPSDLREMARLLEVGQEAHYHREASIRARKESEHWKAVASVLLERIRGKASISSDEMKSPPPVNASWHSINRGGHYKIPGWAKTEGA